MNKISQAQFHQKLQEWEDATKEAEASLGEFLKVNMGIIMDNCPECKGTGRVEDGEGDPAFNPYGHMLYKECSQCEGKGYE